MKKAIKAVYILLVALIVFTGALMIAQGVQEHRYDDAAIAVVYSGAGETPVESLFEQEEGSAI